MVKVINIIVVIPILVCFMLNSCHTDKSSMEIQDIVEHWIGKKIVFPHEDSCISMNRDSNVFFSTPAPYKILVYTDSTGCASCKLDLYKWNMLIKEAKNVMQDSVSFQFYFHPKNINELLFLFQRDRFKHPLYIDKNNQLAKLNNLPLNSRFQIFLLDKNDKVICIGNPVENPKIWKLFKQRIKGEKNSDLDPYYKYPKTSLKVENQDLELNELMIGRTTTAKFKLKNIGENPLVIYNVSAMCSCLVPIWSKKPIQSNEIAEISLKVTPDKKGYFKKMITVYCNIENQNIVLYVRGVIN